MDAADPSPTQPASSAPSKRRRRLVVAVLLSLLGLVAAKPVYRFGKVQYARWQAGRAERFIAEKNWKQAVEALSAANRHGRDDPVVVRAAAAFLMQSGTEPQGLIMLLKRLAELGHGRPEDAIALGHAHIALGDLAAARGSHAGLSPELAATRQALELLAHIQRGEGRFAESEETLRRALMMAPDDPEAMLRLALLDYDNSFAEVQRRGRERVWKVARMPGQTALAAIKVLAQDKNLSAPEAAQLLQELEQHAESPPALRFEVLSAIIRVSPHQRGQVIASEVARQKDKPLAQQKELVVWLAREREHARILQLVSVEAATKSPEIFPYVSQALGEEGRWEDLNRLLNGGQPLPASKARIQVWLAQAAIKMNPDDINKPREHLERAFEQGVKTDDYSSIAAASQVAEACGNYDLALRCYEKLAAATPRTQVEMTEKVLDMAWRLRDSRQVMQASKKLLDMRPASLVFRSRIAYLRLLLGEGMELTPEEEAYRNVMSDDNSGVVPLLFLRALQAHRFNDREELAALLAGSEMAGAIGRLSIGQRAVYAGLLASAGKNTEARRMAEAVTKSASEAVLLPEERAFFDAVR